MKLWIFATLLALLVAGEAAAQSREQVVKIPAAGGVSMIVNSKSRRQRSIGGGSGPKRTA